MNCLIIDKVWGGIAEELSKVMNVKTAANLPCSKEELIAEIGDVDVLIMRDRPEDRQRDHRCCKELKGYRCLLCWFKPHRYGLRKNPKESRYSTHRA